MKYFIATVFLLLVATTAFGQGKITAIHYDISLPDGSMHDYTDDASWLGIGVDGRWFVKPDVPVALGVSFGWHVFHNETDGTIVFDSGALTGKQNRYVNSFPMMLTGHYYFGDKNKLWVFAGGGIGAYYIIQRFEAGVFAFEANNWHFGLYPEIGIQIPLTEMNADLFVSGRYNVAFAAGESLTGEAKEYDYWGINVGLAYNGW